MDFHLSREKKSSMIHCSTSVHAMETSNIILVGISFIALCLHIKHRPSHCTTQRTTQDDKFIPFLSFVNCHLKILRDVCLFALQIYHQESFINPRTTKGFQFDNEAFLAVVSITIDIVVIATRLLLFVSLVATFLICKISKCFMRVIGWAHTRD